MDFGGNIDWFPIRLSFAVAGAATLIALVAGSALAWLLARKRFPGRNLLDSLITLPLVLPPTVLGYYLLVLLGTRSSLGDSFIIVGIRLTFTWGSDHCGDYPCAAAGYKSRLLREGSILNRGGGANMGLAAVVFSSGYLPLASRGVLAATALALRAPRRFGVTIMIAGKFPEKHKLLQ